MALFWLLFLLSTVNVGLGYALAVYLGYGPANLRDAWVALGIERMRPSTAVVAPLPAEDTAHELCGNGNEIAAVPLRDASAEYGGGAT